MIHARNYTANLYATFVDYKGEAAVIAAGPLVSIFHLKDGVVQTDISAQPMTSISGTTYCYPFSIGGSADMSEYVAVYTATYSDGTNAVGSDVLKVVQHKFYDWRRGGGAVSVGPDPTWTTSEKDMALKVLNNLEKERVEIAKSVGIVQKLSQAIAKVVEGLAILQLRIAGELSGVAFDLNALKADMSMTEKILVESAEAETLAKIVDDEPQGDSGSTEQKAGATPTEGQQEGKGAAGDRK